ncbi:MAG: hypothetical protein HYZ74_03680 [Elusimicrobia bacterium]|nr:hypothetical protein [Elusimicrobiota bacterium]
MPTDLYLSAARIEALTAFRSPQPDVLSLHLPVDSAGLYPSILQQITADARRAPEFKAFGRDLEKIERFVASDLVPGPHRFTAVYSCTKRGLFEAIVLPQAFKGTLSAGATLNLRPLSALDGQYQRFGVLLVSASSARLLEIHMGQAVELHALPGDFGDAWGLASVAAYVSAAARKRRFDRLVLGTSAQLESILAPLLDAPLQKMLISEPMLGPSDSLETVLARIAHNERQAHRVRESVLVHRLLRKASSGGAAVGLGSVAAAVQKRRASRVLVRDGYARMGRCCPRCGHLSVDHRSCPWCFCATEAVLDLVGELVDKALGAGCEVFRITHDPRFDSVCRIAAELNAPLADEAPRPRAPVSR